MVAGQSISTYITLVPDRAGVMIGSAIPRRGGACVSAGTLVPGATRGMVGRHTRRMGGLEGVAEWVLTI
jgi:hypothetical protein